MIKNAYNVILKENIKKVIFLVIFLLCFSVINVLSSRQLMHIVDDVLPLGNMEILTKNIVVYVILALFQSLTSYLCSISNSILVLESVNKLKQKLINKLFLRPGAFFSESSKGDIYQTIESDSMQFGSFVVNNMFSLMYTIFTLLAAIIFLAFINIKLLLLTLLIQPFALIIQGVLGPKIMAISEKRRKISGKCSALVQDITANPLELIISGFKKNVEKKVKVKFDEQVKIGKKACKIEMLGINVSDLIDVLTLCLVVGFSGYAIINGSMTVGAFVVFMTYSQKISGGISRLIEFSMDFSEVLPIYNRINEYLEFKPSEKKGLSDLNKDPVIRSEALCFSYDGKKEIYNDLNFVFEKSKSYGIVGRTGEGKSTIVKLLYGLWEPDSGNIFINEEKCSELEYDSISEMVTYVSAAPIVFNDTIFNNIAMYDDTVSSKDLYEVLKKVELYDEVCNMNGKIYSVIGDSGVTISSGQKQRIAIARALLSNRKIIILDEPTSALDIDTKNKITQTIFETFKDKILIIISHDDSLIEKCDKIVFLENGKFKEIFKESSPA